MTNLCLKLALGALELVVRVHVMMIMMMMMMTNTNLCLKLALGALELVVRVHVRTERGSRVRREGAQVAVVDLKED